MTAGSACAWMDVLIFCVLSAALAPPQMPSIQDKRYRRHWSEACLACWLIYAATMLRCPARGPADGDGSGGSAAGGGGTAGLVLWEEEEEDRGVALWQRNNENPTTPTLTDAFAPCIKTPLAGSHLFFIPSLFASQTIEWFGWLGLGRGTVGPYKIKALLFFLYFMTSTKNLKLCCSFNLSFFLIIKLQKVFNFQQHLIISAVATLV